MTSAVPRDSRPDVETEGEIENVIGTETEVWTVILSEAAASLGTVVSKSPEH